MPEAPKLTREQALELEDELILAYWKEEFQTELHEAWDAADGDELGQVQARANVCLPVQIPVIVKYGFAASRIGVTQSVRAFARFDMEVEFVLRSRVFGWLVNPDVQRYWPPPPRDYRSMLQPGPNGIGRWPGLVQVPPCVAQVLGNFASMCQCSAAVHKISGGRTEVFISGKGCEPFRSFLKQTKDCETMTKFLASLEIRLEELARANNGDLSKDITALVGADEMQVPHLDLQPGQVQVIVALTTTTPTLIYDNNSPKPSLADVSATIGVSMRDIQKATSSTLAQLVTGGSPVTLPVSQI